MSDGIEAAETGQNGAGPEATVGVPREMHFYAVIRGYADDALSQLMAADINAVIVSLTSIQSAMSHAMMCIEWAEAPTGELPAVPGGLGPVPVIWASPEHKRFAASLRRCARAAARVSPLIAGTGTGADPVRMLEDLADMADARITLTEADASEG